MGYIDWLNEETRHKRREEVLSKFNEPTPVKEQVTAEDRRNKYYNSVREEARILNEENHLKHIKESKEIAESYNAVYSVLITECFMELFNRSIDNSYDEYDPNVARAFISNYVQEHGPTYILGKMKDTSSMLSEMAFYVEEACKSDDEECGEDIEERNEKKYKIDPGKKDDFLKNLKNTIDIDDVAQTIQLRVSNAMSEFINSNAEKKAEIDDTIEKIKEKIKPDTSEELKEAYQTNANREIERINNSQINLFEKFVDNLSKSVYVNEDAKRAFCENGKINMPKIIQHVKSLYSVLEIFNTTKLEIFTPDKIQEIVESYNMT